MIAGLRQGQAKRLWAHRPARGGLHSEAKISFHLFYKHNFTAILTCHVATATHYNDCRPLPRLGEAFVGASPGLDGGLHSAAKISFHPFHKHCFTAILIRWLWPLGRVWAPAIMPLHYLYSVWLCSKVCTSIHYILRFNCAHY